MFPPDESKKVISAGFNVCLAVVILLLLGFSVGLRSEGADVVSKCKAFGAVTIQGETFNCARPPG